MTSIIVGTDLSENARHAARWAFGLADTLDDDGESVDIVVAHVVGKRDMELRRVISDHSEERECADLKREVVDWIDELDVPDVSADVEVLIGRPADALSRLADERDADWLVVGKSGKGRLERLFVGSTAERLAHCPQCPTVLVHPDDVDWDEPLRALSAVDLGPSSVRAVARAAELVERRGGELTLLHIVSLPQSDAPILDGPPALPDGLETHLGDQIKWARDELDGRLEELSFDLKRVSANVDVRPGYPVRDVLRRIKKTEANLLTLGCRGRSRLGELMLGSVGRSLMKKAPCTVIISPAVEDDQSDEK